MIEHLYPGVFLNEVAFSAKPIDGVATSTADSVGATGVDRLRPEPIEAPVWTDANASDPGLTLVDLFGWVDSFVVYAAPRDLDEPPQHVAVEAGMAGPLAKDPPP
jgi:hypothetical protein